MSAPVLEPEVERRSAGVYFPAMDGYRALAALAVLLAHVALFSGLVIRNHALAPYLARADVGVSVFFLLSGFLLYRPFVAARLSGRSAGSLGSYARRRVLRILPAYWFALTIVAFVLHAPGFHAPHSIIAHYLLLHPYDMDQVTGGPIQQSWTLATEVAFYVFLPVWAWLLARRNRSPEKQIRAEVIGLAALWIGAIVLKTVLSARLGHQVATGQISQDTANAKFGLWGAWLPFRIDEFALGMGMAVASEWVVQRGIRLPLWTTKLAGTLSCWAIAVALFWFTSTQLDLPLAPIFTPRQALVTRLLYSFVALFLLLPAVFGPQGRGVVQSIFANRVMLYLGLISYGIYIWHEAWQDKYLTWTHGKPFQSAFWPMLGVTLGLSVASATLSWFVIEKPALRLKGRR
jgi:peptidoglycan/LPS O-acetylase OafA/YrhL